GVSARPRPSKRAGRPRPPVQDLSRAARRMSRPRRRSRPRRHPPDPRARPRRQRARRCAKPAQFLPDQPSPLLYPEVVRHYRKVSMIQSVERAAGILAVLGSGTPRLGVTEIAERVGLAKPTVHGLLRTLVEHDLVVQDPASGKYSLGVGVLQLGNAYL